jgi:hypothetical protein
VVPSGANALHVVPAGHIALPGLQNVSHSLPNDSGLHW